jgi:non-specific serine/threonine protein kinase
MYALIDWSYQLLCADEQRLFACMSLFAGGCALAQIAAVASVEIDDDVATLDRLSSLVDKSLLVVGVHAGEPRYSLLKSLERYAAEKLELTGDSSRLRRRHADAYTVLAERLEADYDAAATDAWHAHAQIEMENFLTALDWTLDARHDIELGQRLAAALRPSWIIAGDAGRWLGIARELVNDRTPPPLAARLDFAAAAVSYAAADHEATLEAFTRLITVYRELGDPLRSAHAQAYAASALIFLGRLAEAEPLIAPALEIARQGGRPPLIAFVLRAGAFLSLRRGDVDGSRAALTEVLAIYERIGARRHQAVIIGTLAENEFVAGNVEYALQLAMECLGIQRELGWRTHFTRSNICAYNVALDRWELAHVQAREVLELARSPQATAALPLALLHLAAIAVLSTNDDGHSSPPESLARAAQLLGFVDARSTSVLEYTERQEYDRVLAALRTTIDADELAQRMAEGTLLTPDEATEIGLSL